MALEVAAVVGLVVAQLAGFTRGFAAFKPDVEPQRSSVLVLLVTSVAIVSFWEQTEKMLLDQLKEMNFVV